MKISFQAPVEHTEDGNAALITLIATSLILSFLYIIHHTTPDLSNVIDGGKSKSIQVENNIHPMEFKEGNGHKDSAADCSRTEALTKLDIGERCGGIVYAGYFNGIRLYTTAYDQGQFSWNNGTESWKRTGARSLNDGRANTDMLITLSDSDTAYNAALACRSLGSKWYLPSWHELNILYRNRAAIGGFDESGSFPASSYWSSSEGSTSVARVQRFSEGAQRHYHKDLALSVRCVRR